MYYKVGSIRQNISVGVGGATRICSVGASASGTQTQISYNLCNRQNVDAWLIFVRIRLEKKNKSIQLSWIRFERGTSGDTTPRLVVTPPAGITGAHTLLTDGTTQFPATGVRQSRTVFNHGVQFTVKYPYHKRYGGRNAKQISVLKSTPEWVGFVRIIVMRYAQPLGDRRRSRFAWISACYSLWWECST